MPSTRLPDLNRVMIVGNLTGEPDDDADDFEDDEYNGDEKKRLNFGE